MPPHPVPPPRGGRVREGVTKLEIEEKLNGEEILGIQETERGRKIEVSLERIASWALVFTNAFFVSYFLARLFKWV